MTISPSPWRLLHEFTRDDVKSDSQKYRSMVLTGDRLWLGASDAGLFAFDVSRPQKPRPLVSGTAFSCYWLRAGGNLLFEPYFSHNPDEGGLVVTTTVDDTPTNRRIPLAGVRYDALAALPGLVAVSVASSKKKDDADAVALFDVSNPFSPVRKGMFRLNAQPRAMGFSGSVLYVATEKQLVTLEVSKPGTPRELCRLSNVLLRKQYSEFEAGELRSLVVLGDVLVLNNRWVLDIARPAKPKTIDVLKTKADRFCVVREGDRLLVLSEFGKLYSVGLGKRARPLSVRSGQLMNKKGEPVDRKARQAVMIGEHLLVMTANRLAVFGRAPARATTKKPATRRAA